MGGQGGIVLSKKHQFTVNVIGDFRAGKINRKEAAKLLGCSEKKITRLSNRIKEKGIEGVFHGNLSKTPSNKTCPELKAKVMKIVKEKYLNFNMTHTLEMLAKLDGIKLPYSVFQRWCSEAHIKKFQYRRAKPRIFRERFASEGLLLQMDGSPHKWNGKDEWCLISTIDDATSNVPYAEFFTSEDTLNCMTVLRRIIETKGLPHTLYVDQAGTYGGTAKRAEFSQFGRACEELGIHIIFAKSAQGKGRIERSFRTCQDRLSAELIFHGATTIPKANEYLLKTFLKDYWNEKLTVAPRNSKNSYRPLPEGVNLDEVFCKKDYRKIRNDHVVLIDNETYVVTPPDAFSLAGRQLEIRTYPNLKWKAFFAGKEIQIRKIEKPWKKSSVLLAHSRAETAKAKIAG